MTAYRQYRPLRVIRWVDPPSIQDYAADLGRLRPRGLVERVATADLPYDVNPEPPDDDSPTGPIEGLRVLIGIILLAAAIAVPAVTILAFWVFG